MIVWQLLQVRQLADVPLVLIGPMWRALREWASEHMLDGLVELASPGDVAIPTCVDDVDAAFDVVAEHARKWRGRVGP